LIENLRNRITPTPNRRLAKKRVQCLNEALCFGSSSVMKEKLGLLNPPHRKVATPGSEKTSSNLESIRGLPKNNLKYGILKKLALVFSLTNPSGKLADKSQK